MDSTKPSNQEETESKKRQPNRVRQQASRVVSPVQSGVRKCTDLAVQAGDITVNSLNDYLLLDSLTGGDASEGLGKAVVGGVSAVAHGAEKVVGGAVHGAGDLLGNADGVLNGASDLATSALGSVSDMGTDALNSVGDAISGIDLDIDLGGVGDVIGDLFGSLFGDN